MSSIWLNQHRRSETSQYGEDGVLRAIFDRIGEENRWFCEFGAWDGEYLSKTFSLLRDHSWSGVMIEADRARALALESRRREYPRLHAIRGMVRPSGPDSLDEILARTEIPRTFDLLSIDIDNDDYLVWQGLTSYSPRVVVLEVNSQFGATRERIPILGRRGFTERSGCSFASAVWLAKAKGYELALHTGNCIFVQAELAAALDIDPEKWMELFDDSVVQRSGWRRLRTAAGDVLKGRVFG